MSSFHRARSGSLGFVCLFASAGTSGADSAEEHGTPSRGAAEQAEACEFLSAAFAQRGAYAGNGGSPVQCVLGFSSKRCHGTQTTPPTEWGSRLILHMRSTNIVGLWASIGV